MASARKTSSSPKLMRLEPLERKLSRLKREGKKIVFTNGCFDILHVGHVRYLEAAKKLADVLVIGLNSDVSVRGLKGPGRPVNHQEDRAEVLLALRCVDFVVCFSEPTPLETIKALKPDILVKGGDWKLKDIVGGDEVVSRGGRVYSLPFIKGFSTTRTLSRIRGE